MFIRHVCFILQRFVTISVECALVQAAPARCTLSARRLQDEAEVSDSSFRQ